MSSLPTGNRRTGAIPAGAAFLMLVMMTGCTPVARHDPGGMPAAARSAAAAQGRLPVSRTPVLDLDAAPDLAGIIPRLADRRVVLVGESHDRYDHHLTQLEIIRRLHAIHPRLAIGMEAFQQPFQAVLDDYTAGRLSEQDMLRRTEYFRRWRIDYRLYAPILRYAREHRLPVIALNLPAELTRKVGRDGLDALAPEDRAQLPTDIDRSDSAYAQRLEKIFSQHPADGRRFENFLDVQLLWDEGMAERAADYLLAHPDDRMVILAGSGHLARGSGIPRRLVRRLPVPIAVVLNGWDGSLEPGLADFILLTEQRRLPPSGRLGVLLDDEADVPTVSTCLSDSPCTRAGLKQGDRFLSIDGAPVDDMSDLYLAMWDKRPGDTVTLRISRKRRVLPPQELSYPIQLR